MNGFPKQKFNTIVFSAAMGVASGAVVFAFKQSAAFMASLSLYLYESARQNYSLIPVLLIVVALLGLFSAVAVKFLKNCSGGGIPTAIAAIKGFIDFKPIRNLFAVFTASLVSFFAGLPLGSEGPCVQMGAAVGGMFGGKDSICRRTLITSGACAGFCGATLAPISAIIFAFEELRCGFSLLLALSVSIAVLCANLTNYLLCLLFSVEDSLFSFNMSDVLPLRYLWTALIVGLVCGIAAVIYIKLHHCISDVLRRFFSRISVYIKIPLLFVAVSITGLFLSQCLGSGHSLVDEMIEGHGVWYMLLTFLCIRVIFAILANKLGVVGGLFVPVLAFGAIIGSLCAKGLVFAGVLPTEYFSIIVILCISAFLAASAHTPILSVAFAAEALSAIGNILPVAVSVLIAYFFVLVFKTEDLNETAAKAKAKDI